MVGHRVQLGHQALGLLHPNQQTQIQADRLPEKCQNRSLAIITVGSSIATGPTRGALIDPERGKITASALVIQNS
jgi:hypothetical protein